MEVAAAVVAGSAAVPALVDPGFVAAGPGSADLAVADPGFVAVDPDSAADPDSRYSPDPDFLLELKML